MRRAALLICLAGAPLSAQELSLPDATLTAELVEDATFSLPSAAFGDGLDRKTTTGRIARRAWRSPADAREAAAVADTLAQQLEAQGYTTLFACADRACGGYDFRFAVPTLPAPAMFVDLGDYAYRLLRSEAGDLAAVLVSRAGEDVYVQLIAGGATGEAEAAVATPEVAPVDTPGVWAELERVGHVALDDLTFATGSSALASAASASLDALAEGLAADPEAALVLVGHSDTSGGYDPNLALSRARAEAVRRTLIEAYGVAASRITARGVSYLAPRASNATEAGREANRRVEAVLIR